ncbi:hypothetical protein U1Q18_046921 [Sarracenia purpurea var. burkii]
MRGKKKGDYQVTAVEFDKLMEALQIKLMGIEGDLPVRRPRDGGKKKGDYQVTAIEFYKSMEALQKQPVGIEGDLPLRRPRDEGGVAVGELRTRV